MQSVFWMQSICGADTDIQVEFESTSCIDHKADNKAGRHRINSEAYGTV